MAMRLEGWAKGQRHVFAFPRRNFTQALRIHRPSKTEGAGNAGYIGVPAASYANEKAYELVTTGQPNDPAFPARWFTVSFVLSLAIGLFCHHPRRNALALSPR